MKKSFTIFFLIIIYLPSRSQSNIPLKGPCTPEICMNANGNWVKSGDDVSPYLKFSKQQQQEALKRLNAIQDLIFKICPEPKGVDAVWGTTLGNGYFGSLAKYYVKDDKITFDYLKEVITPSLKYACSFPGYYCSNKKNEMMAGYTNETGTFIRIFVNDFQWFATTPLDDTMTVNQMPVKMKHHVKEMWKGYELMDVAGGGNARYVLITRNGMLPYIPVTRKQYLDYCFNYVTKFYDNIITKTEIYQPDKEQRNRQKDAMLKQKNDALKIYRDELEKSTAAHLLDSPAIVVAMTPGFVTSMNPGNGKAQIFITEAEGGQMLVTENPAYMRKDLAKYVPQFFLLAWAWESPSVPHENIRKIIEENFPVEKLQAMIDK